MSAPVAELLAPLANAPHGSFAVLGNHDDEKEVPAALTASGFTVLKDQRTALTIKGERLDLAGIRFWTRTAGESRERTKRHRRHDAAARARSAAARRGGGTRRPAGAVGPHSRRPGHRPGCRRPRRPQVSGARRIRLAREHVDLRQPRRGHACTSPSASIARQTSRFSRFALPKNEHKSTGPGIFSPPHESRSHGPP